MSGRQALLCCAAIANGCMAWLVFDLPVSVDIGHLDPEVPEDASVAAMLAMNGWHLNHGRWVCPAHPVSTSARIAVHGR